MITGREHFLDPYNDGKREIGGKFAQLKELVADNDEQVTRLEQMERTVQFWHVAAGTPEISTRRRVFKSAKDAEHLAGLIAAGKGKETLGEIRKLLTSLDRSFEGVGLVECRRLIATIGKDVADMEAGQLGFLVTGRKEQLEPYTRGQVAFRGHVAQLRQFIKSQNQQASRQLEQIESQVAVWVRGVGEPEITARAEMNLTATTMKEVVRLIESETGKGLIDQFRRQSKTFTDTERRLLASRQEQNKSATDTSVKLILGGTAISMLLAVFLSIWVTGTAGGFEEASRALAQEEWIRSGQTGFAERIQGEQDRETLSRNLVTFLAEYLGASVGVCYLVEGDGKLRVSAGFAHEPAKHAGRSIEAGEGLVGQALVGQAPILLDEVPADYIQVDCGLGSTPPRSLALVPLVMEGEVKGILELGSLQPFGPKERELLDRLSQAAGSAIQMTQNRAVLKETLHRSQVLSQELEARAQELRTTNEQLGQQSQALQVSEEQLRSQAQELRATNEELKRKSLNLKAASKYKTEFLANMSHELRTPLNSLLILAKLLYENPDDNLDEKQVEFAETIHASGAQLLSLINEILDLSKVEAGVMAVNISDISLEELGFEIQRAFGHVAEEKGLEFAVHLDEGLAPIIQSDKKRLMQVLSNLLGNAFKFTGEGSVELRIGCPVDGWDPEIELLGRAERVVAFGVKDTGVGIPEDNQAVIFNAFERGRPQSNQEFAGTGLGLSISQELAGLLGGQVKLSSEPGKGSTFTLYLPLHVASAVRPALSPASPTVGQVKALDVLAQVEQVPDDRNAIGAGCRVLLIIEDDLPFARILLDLAREKGFKGVVSSRGDHGLVLARQLKPDAITLDLRLPEMSGWVVLDRLKHSAQTRHIPVHIISVEDGRQRGLSMGAVSFLRKPVEREALETTLDQTLAGFDRLKRILLVESDPLQSKNMLGLVGSGDIETTSVESGAEAFEALQQGSFDCVILDLILPDMSGLDLLQRIESELVLADLPVIVYTGKDFSKEEESELRRYAETIFVKGVSSPERLLAETALFLHRVEEDLEEAQQRMIQQAYREDPALAGKTLLIVDDDIRSLFALTSVLQRYKMNVIRARNGCEALELLEQHPDVDGILMDVMMPEMDGCEATRRIRKMPAHRRLPIIVLTAKAMEGDREACMEAGASDYLRKPVDTDQLLSLLRVWLYQ